MFGNNPFIKKDSIVESVAEAMRLGELRRNAEAFVNEQFGVYNRNGVIRENLAEYDSAVKSVYEEMLSEAEHPMFQGARHKGKDEPTVSSKGLARSAMRGPSKPAPAAKGGHWFSDKSLDKFAGMSQEKKGEVLSTAKEKFKAGTEKLIADIRAQKAAGKDKTDPKDPRAEQLRQWKMRNAMREETIEEKLAKKDYDKDGKIESEKDEVWGSRLRAAKAKGQINEVGDTEKGREKLMDYQRKAAKGDKDERKGYNRAIGLHRAAEKYVKGKKKALGVERLDELSREGILQRYATKTREKVDTGAESSTKRAKGRELAGRKRWGGVGGIPKAKVMAKEESLNEKAPPGAKFERMVKHIKKGYGEDGLSKKEKGWAYATAWKAYKKKHGKK